LDSWASSEGSGASHEKPPDENTHSTINPSTIIDQQGLNSAQPEQIMHTPLDTASSSTLKNAGVLHDTTKTDGKEDDDHESCPTPTTSFGSRSEEDELECGHGLESSIDGNLLKDASIELDQMVAAEEKANWIIESTKQNIVRNLMRAVFTTVFSRPSQDAQTADGSSSGSRGARKAVEGK
jgi:hypothetical protein